MQQNPNQPNQPKPNPNPQPDQVPPGEQKPR